MSTVTSSTISSYDDALDFLPRAGQTPPHRGLFATLRLVAEAFRDALAAERRYHQLTYHGVTPAKAVAVVLDEHFRAA